MAISAVYPTSIVSFTSKVDNLDPVIAADVNAAYAEIRAIEDTLGQVPATGGLSNTFTQTSTPWSNVAARISNIESGLFTAYNDRVSLTGGSVIDGNTANKVALKLQTTTSKDLLQAGATVLNKDGVIVAIDCGNAI